LSHHEKVVVVDCSIAFVAEIDLCFGCWDTHSHEMVDNYSAHPYFEREIEAIPNACGFSHCSGNTFYGRVRTHDYVEIEIAFLECHGMI